MVKYGGWNMITWNYFSFTVKGMWRLTSKLKGLTHEWPQWQNRLGEILLLHLMSVSIWWQTCLLRSLKSWCSGDPSRGGHLSFRTIKQRHNDAATLSLFPLRFVQTINTNCSSLKFNTRAVWKWHTSVSYCNRNIFQHCMLDCAE